MVCYMDNIVTILVPTYNVEKYISKCLDSLVCQTYEYIDIHVIDDGSLENEKDIVEKYINDYPDKIRYTRKINGGYGSVLYEGIHSTNATYFLVCDPDDWLEPNAIESLVNIMKRENADLVCSARYIVNELGEKTYDKMFNSSHVQLMDQHVYSRANKDFGQVYLIENAPHGKLFKHSLIKELYFPHKATNTDTLLYFGAVFNSHKIIYTSEPLANYLILREGNTVSSVKPSLIDGMNISHIETLNLSESYSDLSPAFYFQMLIAFHYICDRCVLLDVDNALKKSKLLETGHLLQYLIKHRFEVIKYYLQVPSYNLNYLFKNILLLSPLTSKLAFQKLIKNRLNEDNKKHLIKEFNQIKHRELPLSIIVPIYNVEKYLSKCLESLKIQSFENFEVLCVNDGSTDNSQSIVESFVNSDKRFKSFIKENGGLSDARNFGIQHARGDYLFFLDSDDWIEADTLKVMYENSISKQSDIVVCDMVYDYEDGTTAFTSGGEFSCFETDEFNNVIEINNSACNKLYHHSLLNQHSFIKGIWYEDLASIPGILLNTKRITKVNHTFYHYFQRNTSIVHTENKKILDIYIALDAIKSQCEEHGWSKSLKKSYLNLLITHALEFTTLRIREFKSNRVSYMRTNMKNLRERYFFWFLNPLVWNQGPKRIIINVALIFRIYPLVLWFYDRKGHA